MRPGTTLLRATVAALCAAACLSASVGPTAAATTSTATAPVPVLASIPGEPLGPERDALFAGINADRAAAGLVRYVRDPALELVAQARVQHLASSTVFGHAEAGAPILDSVEATGIAPLGVGEALGWSSRTGDDALTSIRSMWQTSPSHRAIVVSDESSYAGVGVLVQDGRTWVALVTAETADRTPPVVGSIAVRRQGASTVVTWGANDPILQTHTAGVRDAWVEYRVAGGSWRVLQQANVAGIARLPRIPAGVIVEVRVRARDRAGNLSTWAQTAATAAP